MLVPNIDRNVPALATLTVTVLLVRFMLLMPPSIMLLASWYVESARGTANEPVIGTVDNSISKMAPLAVASMLSEASE